MLGNTRQTRISWLKSICYHALGRGRHSLNFAVGAYGQNLSYLNVLHLNTHLTDGGSATSIAVTCSQLQPSGCSLHHRVMAQAHLAQPNTGAPLLRPMSG